MQAAPVAPMPMAAFEAYASKAAIGVGATGAIGCSAQRSSCGVARVGGEKWGVRFHVFPNSDGSPLKWDTPHINQPINQGFLVLGWDMELLKPRFEWLPTPVLLGILPAGVPAPAPASSLQPRPTATSGAGTDWRACSLSSNDSRLMAPAWFTTRMLFHQFPRRKRETHI